MRPLLEYRDNTRKTLLRNNNKAYFDFNIIDIDHVRSYNI